MNAQDMLVILQVLKASYPRFYTGMTKDEIVDTVNVWTMMFADDDAKIVTEAVKAMVATLKFPPTIADIKEKIQLITAPKQITEMEAWNIVYKAICDANYNAQQHFENFPTAIKTLVGDSKQLKEWAVMEHNTVKSVIQSNFMRSYKARCQKNTELDMLPESTKAMVAELSGKMIMIESEQVNYDNNVGAIRSIFNTTKGRQ